MRLSNTTNAGAAKGWQCPVCGVGNAPTVTQCPCKPLKLGSDPWIPAPYVPPYTPPYSPIPWVRPYTGPVWIHNPTNVCSSGSDLH